MNREGLVANSLQSALRSRRTGVRRHQHHSRLLVDEMLGGQRLHIGRLAVEQIRGITTGRIFRRQFSHAGNRRHSTHLSSQLPAVADLPTPHTVQDRRHGGRTGVDGREAVVQNARIDDLATPQGASLPPTVVGGGVTEADEHRRADAQHGQHCGGVLNLARVRYGYQQPRHDQHSQQVIAELPQDQTGDLHRTEAADGPDHVSGPMNVSATSMAVDVTSCCCSEVTGRE